jgi:hypothetical protein
MGAEKPEDWFAATMGRVDGIQEREPVIGFQEPWEFPKE